MKTDYGSAILQGFEYVLSTYPEVFVVGQGLWSPWYVGNSMTDLDKKFGEDRVIDTPVSESATTGVAVGASLAGMRPIVVHPRMDFMLYAMDAIVNQAAKWSHMFGGQAHPGLTIRGIINRGGEQGAQHSQALHAWFSHVPGLRVVMPSSVADARDLFVASVLSDDPVVYIDDRWLYDTEEELGPLESYSLNMQGPRRVREGSDVTLVGSGYATRLAMDAAEAASEMGITADVIDLRVLNPLDPDVVIDSVLKTRTLIVVDPGTRACGFSAEVVASVCEHLDPGELASVPKRVTLPDAPAPTSRVLQDDYYITAEQVLDAILETVRR